MLPRYEKSGNFSFSENWNTWKFYHHLNFGALLEKHTLTISVSLRIGADIFHLHLCVCGALVDKLEQHGFSCLIGAGRLASHNSINILKRALVSADSNDLTLILWNKGNELVWDVTVADTLAP